MQDALKIAAIQANLFWEDQDANLRFFKETIAKLSSDTELVVLPEMFSTGFTMNPEKIAEKMDGKTVVWMNDVAKEKGISIVGSIVIEEHGNYYNRAVFVYPSGEFMTYDKRHSFGLAGEDEKYTSGDKRLIVEYKGWKIFPLICYDLRFPVWSRYDNDLVLFMANWPKPRIQAWDSLLKARAIENMSYCVGVNRVGEDANGYEYIGHTTVFDFLGNQIAETKESEVGYLECTLVKSKLNEARKKLNFLNDRDQFEIIL